MSDLPRIATLWIDGPLGWIERLCLHSFVHHGHDVTVFTFGEVTGLPDGAAQRDAREIWDCPQDILDHCPAAYVADIFRLYLVRQSGFVWVDTDAMCLAPFRCNEDGYLVGFVPEVPAVNNGVMGLPQGSHALGAMISAFEDDTVIPPWLPPRMQRRLGRVPLEERRYQRPHVFRTIFGPHALTHLMRESGEIVHAHRPQVLFPVPWHSVDVLFNPFGGAEGWMDHDTISMHIYTSSVRDWHRHRRPPAGSFLRREMKKMRFPWRS